MAKARIQFPVSGKWYELRWSAKKNRPVVVVVDEDWDYEDEAHAADLSEEIRDAKSLEAAAEMLGVGEGSSTFSGRPSTGGFLG